MPHHAFLPHLLLAMGFKPKPDWYLDPLPERNAVKAGVRDPAPWAGFNDTLNMRALTRGVGSWMG